MVARQEDSWNCRLKKRNFVAQTLNLGPDNYQMTRLQQGHNFSGCGYESPLITAVDVKFVTIASQSSLRGWAPARSGLEL